MSVILAALFASSAVTAMQRALDSSAEWTMERKMSGSERVLVSSGTVDCKAGRGIAWKVKEPFESSVEMTTNSMVFADEAGVRVKPLEKLPHYAEIRRATDAFAAGDTNAFSKIFRMDLKEFPDGGWTLSMRPQAKAMRRILTGVEISGAHLPTNAVLSSPSCVSVIRFRESGSGK